MHFTADRLGLMSAVSAVLPFADSGAIHVTPRSLRVTAATKSEGAAVHTSCDIRETHAFTVPIPQLVAWLADSAAGSVAFRATDGGSIAVTGVGSEKLSFPVGNPDTIPVPAPSTAPEVTLSGETFRRLVHRTAFAARRADSMGGWKLTVVRFEAQDGILTLAAADGYHMAFATAPVESAPRFAESVPLRQARVWARSCDPGNPVSLRFDRVGHFSTGILTAWSSLLVCPFPFPRPLHRPHAATMKTADLTRAVRMALAGADPDPEDEMDPMVRFVDVRVSGSRMSLRGEASGLGLAAVSDVTLAEPAPTLATELDGYRLLRWLKAVRDEDAVVMRWAEPRDGMVHEPFEFAAGDARYLTQPRVYRDD